LTFRVAVQGDFPLADQGRRGVRVDLQGVVVRLGGLAAVVLLEEQGAGEVLGRPEVGVGLEGVADDVLEDVAELVGEVVPAGVLAAGLGDDQQLVGVLDVVAVVAALVVVADEPAELGVGPVEVAAVAVDLGPRPARREVVLVLVEGGRRGLQGLVPPAQPVEQFGLGRQQPYLFGRVLQGGVEHFQRLGVLPLALQRPAQAGRTGGPRRLLAGEALVQVAGLLVVAAQPALAGLLERRVVRRGERGRPREQQPGVQGSSHR
jgi:hypothetical protein